MSSDQGADRNIYGIATITLMDGTQVANQHAGAARIKIAIAGGAVITSSITKEAVQDLDLKAGDEASAVIKASDVIVAQP